MDEIIQPINSTALPAEKSTRFLVLWVLYFLQYAAIGAYFTFLNVYYGEVGLSGTQMGLVEHAGGHYRHAAPFVWGYAADRTGRANILITAGAVGALLLAQLVPLVKAAGLVNPFLWYSLIGMAFSFITGAASTLVDSTCLAMLGERSNEYGRFRLGGSIGYIVVLLTIGFVYERTGLNWMFPIYGAIMLAFGLTALRLPRHGVQLGDRSWSRIGAMVRQPVWLVLVGTGFLYTVAFNAALMFTGVILKSMGASDSLISFAMVIGTIAEVPFMALSNRLLKFFGPVRLLLCAILLQTVRYFLLSRITDPASAVAINLLNGPGTALFMISILDLISRLAPPGLLATAQGFYNSAIGVAGILASLISGILLDRIGQSGLFLILAGICAASFVLFGLGIALRRQSAGLAD